ncbi:alpha/beta fold hydrolase [Pseudacidovorax intermedius]|uniref:alpha/beta fold hydrolase n=1 Tax=Pseudacidovorax intermedius TaxID=433924 RepID=UPI0026F27629|nr:alpha/beta hydrolase [Pseudacidovorax intermedius]
MSRASIPRGDGHALHVRDWGEGPPVVLLAGWAMDGRIWGETMLHLNAAGLRTIAYDRNGHGRSTDRPGYDYDALADDLAAVLEDLDLRGVTLVAHSGAGGEALRYLARHGRARVARLILVGATGPRVIGQGGITAEMVDLLCGQLGSDLTGWIDANIGPFAPGSPARINDWMAAMVLDCSRRAVVEFQRTIAHTDLSADAASVNLPVTIIHGDRDVSAPLDLSGRAYAETIPGAELVVYEGVAHGVMVTHARRLADDIARRVAP